MNLLRTAPRHRRLALAWWLAAALLLAQALGLVHAVRHAPGLVAPHATAHAQAHAHAHAHAHGTAPVDAAAAFGGHAEDDVASCQLYDQLTHADLLPTAALPPPAAAAAPALPAAPPAGRLPRCSTGYSARAPPRG